MWFPLCMDSVFWGQWVLPIQQGKGGAEAVETLGVTWNFKEMILISFQLFHQDVYIRMRNSFLVSVPKPYQVVVWLQLSWNFPLVGKTLKMSEINRGAVLFLHSLFSPNPEVPRKELYPYIFRHPAFSTKPSFSLTTEDFTVNQAHYSPKLFFLSWSGWNTATGKYQHCPELSRIFLWGHYSNSWMTA